MDQVVSNDVGSTPLGGRARWLARGRGNGLRCDSMRRLRVKTAAVVTDWARLLASGSTLGCRLANLVSMDGRRRMVEQPRRCGDRQGSAAAGASRRGAIVGLVEPGSGEPGSANSRERQALRAAEVSIARQGELSARRRPREAFGNGRLANLVSLDGRRRMVEQPRRCGDRQGSAAAGSSRRCAIVGLVEPGSGEPGSAKSRERLAIWGDGSVSGLAGGGIGTLGQGDPLGGGRIAHFAHPPTSNALLLLHARKKTSREQRSWQT